MPCRHCCVICVSWVSLVILLRYFRLDFRTILVFRQYGIFAFHFIKISLFLKSFELLGHLCTSVATFFMVNQLWLVWFIMFTATFKHISVISWLSVLLVEETWVPRENYRPAESHWQTLSYNVESSKPRYERGSNSQLPYDHGQDSPCNYNDNSTLFHVMLLVDVYYVSIRVRRGHDRMVDGFTTTYAISAYHHWCCEVESRSGRCVQHCDKVCQWPATSRWVYPDPPVSSINKTNSHDILVTYILLKVTLNTIKQTLVLRIY